MAKSKKSKKSDRAILHPAPISDVLYGDRALTIEETINLLGWVEEPEGEEWGNDHCGIVSKEYGKKVRLMNNLVNRPIDRASLKRYVQDILNGCWKLNGENIVIGITGQIMSGQHRLISHILAEHQRLENLDHWKTRHPDPIRLETFIAYGVEESDEIFRTLNTGKPASVADTLYRSALISRIPLANRRTIARILDRAISCLWGRLGYSNDQWADIRTNTEAQLFLEKHETLVECAEYLLGENSVSDSEEEVSGKISDIVPLGTATALFYLMAVSDSDSETYHLARFKEKASEKLLNMNSWEAARLFWYDLGAREERMEPVLKLIQKYQDKGVKGGATESVLCRAWVNNGNEFDLKSLTLKLTPEIDGEDRRVDENYTCGGVDLGTRPEAKEEEVSEATPAEEPRSSKPNLKKDYPGYAVIYRNEEGSYLLGDDALEAAKIETSDIDPETKNSVMKRFTVVNDNYQSLAENFNRVGRKVVVVNAGDNEVTETFGKIRKK